MADRTFWSPGAVVLAVGSHGHELPTKGRWAEENL